MRNLPTDTQNRFVQKIYHPQSLLRIKLLGEDRPTKPLDGGWGAAAAWLALFFLFLFA